MWHHQEFYIVDVKEIKDLIETEIYKYKRSFISNIDTIWTINTAIEIKV